MIEVFDKTRRRVAILENAYAASESQKINSVWYFYFSLPYGDSKNEYCKPFYYVRPDGGELYRIMPETLSVSESGGVSYQCEHVLATLIDNVLFGYHVVGNLGVYTADVIRYILDHQLVKNWVLDECDFRNQFEYGWEQESLLSALFSVLSPLSSPMIVTDTTVYPWRLSLKKLVTTGRPEMYVRRRYNMTSYTRGRDPQNIVTRLYPLGYGEGINQLNIKGVNDGVPYIQSPKEITDKYGIIERVWIDRRYEDAASLKAAAEIMLSELQEPLVSYSVGFHELTASDYDKAAIGKRVRIIFPEVGDSVDTYITELTRKRDDLKESTITVANRETSIAASLADMADRQRIEQTYAQGATQIYSQALQANSAPDSGATMDFFLPSEMRIVNKVLVKVRIKKFRAYSKATEAAESKTITSSTSDEDTRTSSSGGRTTATTTSGGGTYTSTTYEAKKTLTATAVILSAENIYPTEAAMYNAAKHNHGIPDRVKLAVYGGKDANGNVIADGYLYLVEFANWNGQTKIGRGNVDSGSVINTGGTDSMTYHTGRAAGTDGNVAIQYRNIENWWGNVLEWRDGIIFSGANICTYNNPANFADTYNGTGATVRSNTRATSGGWIKAWGHDSSDNSFIYPNTVGGSDTTYVPDYCYYYSGVRGLYVGGNFNYGTNAGPFYLGGNNAPSSTSSNLGSRLQKLPSAA